MSFTIEYPVKSISLEKFTSMIRIIGRHNADSIVYNLNKYIIKCDDFNHARLIIDEMGNVGMKASMID